MYLLIDGMTLTDTMYRSISDAQLALAALEAGVIIRIYGNGERETIARKARAA